MVRILFIVPYPTAGPSNRYRVEQYLPFLKEKGIDFSLRPFISEDLFKVLYKKGNQPKKILYFAASVLNRLIDAINSFNYDLVFVHIESFPFGPAFLEWFFAKIGKPVIYDFEDAVYLKNFRGNNPITNYLRYPHKFYQILSLSSHVIVCNNYMRQFIYPYNQNVTVIPTSIDTGKFSLKDPCAKNPSLVIGWIGSHSTTYCLKPLTEVFQALSKKHDFLLKIIGANESFSIPGVNIVKEKWSLEKDVASFQGLDIGIYPLPSDERAMAKTPFKTIQYMSVGVPAVVSRVGGNTEIIKDGENGFLASGREEWINKLSLLIESTKLRQTISLAGRKTVEERYSLRISAPKFLKVIEKAYNKKL